MVGALNDEQQLKQLYALMGGRLHYIEELCLQTKEDSSKSCLVDCILHEFFNEWTSNPSFRVVMKKLVKDTINMASAGLPKGEAAVDPFWAKAWVHFTELSDAQILEAWLYKMGNNNLLFMELSKAGLRV